MNQPTEVTAMAAISEEGNIIGNTKTNSLPGWNLPGDRKHMSERTKGNVVFYGKNTFESFPEKFRPLPGRDNIIVTRNVEYEPFPKNEQTYVCNSVTDAVSFAAELAGGEKEIFCFGGGEIYQQIFTNPAIRVNRLILTIVNGEFEGDVLFPSIDLTLYKKVSSIPYEKDEKNSHSFNIVTYELL